MSKRIERHNAESFLGKLLLNSYVEEVRAHSIQSEIVFFSDAISDGTRTKVDLVFTCDADVYEIEKVDNENGLDFFSRRAMFLSRVYALIGNVVSKVIVQENGGLILLIGDSKVELSLSVDDNESDDWVWKVEAEEGALESGNVKAVLCSPDTGSVEFYALAKGD